MKIYPSDTALFYNPDCQKWGVMQITKAYILHSNGMSKQMYKWTQVTPRTNKLCYTPYRKVAERWAKKIMDKGVIECRADIAYEPEHKLFFIGKDN